MCHLNVPLLIYIYFIKLRAPLRQDVGPWGTECGFLTVGQGAVGAGCEHQQQDIWPWWPNVGSWGKLWGPGAKLWGLGQDLGL